MREICETPRGYMSEIWQDFRVSIRGRCADELSLANSCVKNIISFLYCQYSNSNFLNIFADKLCYNLYMYIYFPLHLPAN